jgi:hypothetical protein
MIGICRFFAQSSLHGMPNTCIGAVADIMHFALEHIIAMLFTFSAGVIALIMVAAGIGKVGTAVAVPYQMFIASTSAGTGRKN